MKIRNYNHKSPITYSAKIRYPRIFIDLPHKQLEILKTKYSLRKDKTARIPIPKNTQELWAQHKYSVMARNPIRYKEIGKFLSKPNNNITIEELILEFIKILRTKPQKGKLNNSIDHMWGYVSKYSDNQKNVSVKNKFELILEYSLVKNEKYLLHSTALSDLYLWL